MSDSQKSLDLEVLNKTILTWLQARLRKESYQWIFEMSKRLSKDAKDWEFFSSFSAVPQHTGKRELELSAKEKKKAEEIRQGWQPRFWSIDELARTLLVLSITELDKSSFLEKLEKVFISSDMGEAIALYKSLAVLPYPEDLSDRAAEGIRSNISSVFDAVALRNPYPAEYMDKLAWNQIVLKALFVGSPLYLIYGIDRRSNEKLAYMLVDYAHERWAAGRSVSPELWRPVGPFINEKSIDDLQRVLDHPDIIQQQAAMLSLMESSYDGAQQLVENHKGLKREMQQQNVTWADIGQRFNND